MGSIQPLELGVMVCDNAVGFIRTCKYILIVLVRQSDRCCRCRWPTNKSKIHCNFSSELDILLCKLESTSFRAVVRDFYFYCFVFVLFSLFSSSAHVPRFLFSLVWRVCSVLCYCNTLANQALCGNTSYTNCIVTIAMDIGYTSNLYLHRHTATKFNCELQHSSYHTIKQRHIYLSLLSIYTLCVLLICYSKCYFIVVNWIQLNY